MSSTKPTSRRYVIELVVASALVVVSGIIYLNRQYVFDSVSVWRYQPSFEIAHFADRGGMNDKGRFYFYAAHPELLSSVEFSYHCGSKDVAASILGCYKENKIYIYDVENAKLDGIRTVTAVHEMLHVAYGRLSESDKNMVNRLVEREYDKLKHTSDFEERMDFYDKSEPGERDNELHSIIGTEVKSISPELEKYYGRYFDDRQKVVSHHSKYISAFTDLQKKSEKLVKQLNALADSINSRTKKYNTAVASFNSRVTQFKNQSSSGYFSSYDEYEARRQALMSESAQLNDTNGSINADIKQYKKLKSKLSKLGEQYSELTKSIDSTIVESPDQVRSKN